MDGASPLSPASHPRRTTRPSLASPTEDVAARLERLLPALWSACFTPLPPGEVGELPVAQARTLTHLAHVGCRRMGALADDLGVRLPTASRIVDRLEERGLAVREPDADDGRAVVVRATPAGARIAAEARRFRHGVIGARLDGLSREQTETLATALDLLEQAVSGDAGRSAARD
jgi:DNA-binding MarR family transcriptional regulator